MTLEKHNAPWTRKDLSLLRQCARRRLSSRAAAALLGRTVGSVKYKAMTEGVHFRAINQARGVQKRPSLRRKLARIRNARVRRERRTRRAA